MGRGTGAGTGRGTGGGTGGGAARVVAVVVAHDRRALLLEALGALAASTTPPAAVVVVDNASGDGSGPAAQALGAERDLAVDLVRLGRNTGGAGGFGAGLARALTEHAPDLVWLMDDDTVPTPTALAELLAVRDRYTAVAGRAPVLLASRVVWHDGREHPMNTPRRRPGVRRAQRELAARAGGTPVRSASFVSVLLDAGAVRAHGLPVADYFLWNDDFEHSTRLLRSGVGLHCPASVVVHKTAVFGSTDADPGTRFAYEVRNKLWMFTRSSSLAPWEKVLYGGSSLLRWVRTLVRSRARGVLVAGLRRGAAQALAAPRPTAVVLAGLGPVSDAVAAVEAGAGR